MPRKCTCASAATAARNTGPRSPAAPFAAASSRTATRARRSAPGAGFPGRALPRRSHTKGPFRPQPPSSGAGRPATSCPWPNALAAAGHAVRIAPRPRSDDDHPQGFELQVPEADRAAALETLAPLLDATLGSACLPGRRPGPLPGLRDGARAGRCRMPRGGLTVDGEGDPGTGEP